MAKEKYTAEQVAKALIETKGMLTLAAKRLGCDYHTVQRYIRDYATVRDARQQAYEALGDAAELKLYNKALGTATNPDGDTASLLFLLKTRYKGRGYVERTEQVNFNVDNDLIKRAIEAIEKSGLSASDVFEQIIQHAAEETHAEVAGTGGMDEGGNTTA